VGAHELHSCGTEHVAARQQQWSSARLLSGTFHVYEGVFGVGGGHFSTSASARPSYLSESLVDSLDMRAVIGMVQGGLVAELN
jgi:hypothetical protein